jgi:drug/metabolite transporter (DMT)-like permease
MSSSNAPHPQRTQALLMLLVANLCWGLSFPLIKSILLLHERIIPEAGTWFSAIYTVAPRFFLAFLVLMALKPLAWRGVTRGELKQGLVIGLFASAGMLLQNDALQFTSASTSAFLTQFYAILIPIYVAVRARRNPGGRVWLSCALVLAGVAILGRFDWRQLHLGRGEWETLLASVFFMGQILWLEKKEFAANRAFELTLVMFATEALVFAVLAGATAPSVAVMVVPWTSPVWLGFTVTLTVVCTLGAFGLMNAWQPKITATEAGLIYCVEPIFGSLAALFLPAVFSVWAMINYANETATWTLLVGGGLITAANILIQLKPTGKG